MATDAQRRANSKYRRENTHSFSMRFFPSEEELWEHLEAQERKTEYVKALIRADMERQRTE
ncbi:MAG: hypothetical protein IKG69_11760 [Atopobiaceae bacterium]|nr:hypothetical protein [Atopobiaceae bacterium]